MAKLRWGILSTARIADQLVRAIHLSSNSELVAVASRDLKRAQEWAQKRDVPRTFGSYEEMLASDAIDAVYLPLPNSLHAQWSLRAAQHHKHVLCEKPLASNAAEVAEMLRTAKSNGVKLMEAFMYRFHPQWQVVRRMLDEDAIGQVTLIRGTFDFYLGNLADIRLSKELAGGSLMDVGCYPVNAARMLMDAEPVAVQASAVWGRSPAQVVVPMSRASTASTSGTSASVSDSVDVSFVGALEFANGALAAIDSSFRAENHQWVGISGTKGHIGVLKPFRMGEESTTILLDHDGKGETLAVPGANEYHLMVEHFADAVLNDQPLAYPPEDSLRQIRVMDALYESAREGKRVLVGE
jgi:D-xylose 1-dehydrogenase (NADP+, D-xylono-1,5-lactone-forming)